MMLSRLKPATHEPTWTADVNDRRSRLPTMSLGLASPLILV